MRSRAWKDAASAARNASCSSGPLSSASSMLGMIAPSRLLKLCASPAESWPSASTRCARCRCAAACFCAVMSRTPPISIVGLPASSRTMLPMPSAQRSSPSPRGMSLCSKGTCTPVRCASSDHRVDVRAIVGMNVRQVLIVVGWRLTDAEDLQGPAIPANFVAREVPAPQAHARGIDGQPQLLLAEGQRAFEAHALGDVGRDEHDHPDGAVFDHGDGADQVGVVRLAVLAVRHRLVRRGLPGLADARERLAQGGVVLGRRELVHAASDHRAEGLRRPPRPERAPLGRDDVQEGRRTIDERAQHRVDERPVALLQSLDALAENPVLFEQVGRVGHPNRILPTTTGRPAASDLNSPG